MPAECITDGSALAQPEYHPRKSYQEELHRQPDRGYSVPAAEADYYCVCGKG